MAVPTDIQYTVDGTITPEEMQDLAEAVGFGPYRTIERNRIALAGSLFAATARHNGRLVGLLRIVGDGAYILHMADLEVHPDFQNRRISHTLMKMALDYAREKRIGVGDNLGEFTLFANVGADRFYEKLGLSLTPNGMVLTDTKSRRECESNFRKQWMAKRNEARKKTCDDPEGSGLPPG